MLAGQKQQRLALARTLLIWRVRAAGGPDPEALTYQLVNHPTETPAQWGRTAALVVSRKSAAARLRGAGVVLALIVCAGTWLDAGDFAGPQTVCAHVIRVERTRRVEHGVTFSLCSLGGPGRRGPTLWCPIVQRCFHS